jgi:hypothetical protein
MSDVLLAVQIIVSIVMLSITLYFLRDYTSGKSTLSEFSTLLNPEGDLTLALTEARSFMQTITEPELRAELLKGLASELLEVFNFWRMGVKGGATKKMAAVESKLTEVFAEEIVPEMLDDPLISKLAKIVMKNARVRSILEEHDVSMLDLMELAGPLLQNFKFGQAPEGLDKPAQSQDGVIWFIQP